MIRRMEALTKCVCEKLWSAIFVNVSFEILHHHSSQVIGTTEWFLNHCVQKHPFNMVTLGKTKIDSYSRWFSKVIFNEWDIQNVIILSGL